MKRGKRGPEDKSAVNILEEATHRLRVAPSLLVPYYIGSLPFMLGFLYFWTDMSTGSNAWRHCSQSAWGLVLLFVWMKTWQSVYAHRFLAAIRGERPSSWSLRRILRVSGIQTAVQPWSILLMPLAFLIMLPFPQILAFFQNAVLVGSGDGGNIRTIIRKSWRQASVWPMQNMLIIWLVSPFLLAFCFLFIFLLVPFLYSLNPSAPTSLLLFLMTLIVLPLCPLGMVTALNIGITVYTIPWLLKMLFDVETLFSISGAHLMNNTFIIIVYGLSYLCLDPLLKASYWLRCFYGESVSTGEDLRVELGSIARTGTSIILILLLFITFIPVGHAQTESPEPAVASRGSSVSSKQLDSAIESILKHPDYTWRMPREKPPEVKREHGIFYQFLDSIISALKNGLNYVKKCLHKAWDYLVDILSHIIPSLPKLERPDTHWTSFSRRLIIIPLVIIGILLAFFTWRAWRDRSPYAESTPLVSTPIPDITREEVDVAELPEDGWLNLAGELMEKGELRLALRALYLATLAFLAQQDLITITRYKSDGEYESELKRRSHERPNLLAVFSENRMLFQRAWYGLHDVTSGMLERFSQNQKEIKIHAKK